LKTRPRRLLFPGLTIALLLFWCAAISSVGVSSPARPSIPVPTNAWTTFQVEGFPAEIVGYDATVYASAIKRHIVLGKYHHYGSEPNYCMDAWSYDENRWDILDCGDYWHTEHMMEGGHPVGAFVYMPSRRSILYWGGQSGSNQPEQAFHTWWWDVAGHTGRDKLGTTRPGNIKVSAMAYDQVHDKALFFPDSAFKIEIYDPASNAWSTPSTSGTPPSRGLTFPSLDWDSHDEKMYLFGGAAGNSCNSGTLRFNGDVYTFDLTIAAWRKLVVRPDPVNGLPAGRWYAGFAYDPTDNIFLLVGGQDCSAAEAGAEQVGLTDTWKLDMNVLPPQWSRLAPLTNYVLKSPADAPFNKLRYDTDQHAFVMILPSYNKGASTGGLWGNYTARIWVYCYTGSCPNVGAASTTYPVPSQSLNRNARPISSTDQTWASDTAVATHGSTIYAAWIETGAPFANGRCIFHHPYVQSLKNGTSWSDLGKDCSALDSHAETWERDGEKPSLAVVDGTVWASWSESGGPTSTPNTVIAKSWNGSIWTGAPIGTRNKASRSFQGASQLIAVGKTPTIAFIENNKELFPDITEVYVDQYNGKSWVALGQKLNTTPSSRAESLAIASDGDLLLACWTEEVIAGWTSVNPSQLYCARWDGSKWSRIGSSLNQSTSKWAEEASLTILNGKPYLAWTERTTAGNPRLFVKTYDGSKWLLVGGRALNKNEATGWPFHPRLVNDGANLYLSWEEQEDLGQPSRLYVSSWSGGGWVALGRTLNQDTQNGSAMHSSIALLNGSPVVIWNEVQLGQLQQTYAKQWNGSNWSALGGRKSEPNE
jgi:hypothetical protein